MWKLVLLLSCAFALTSQAEDFRAGSFSAFEESNKELTFCDRGVSVTLAKGDKFLGNRIYLTNFLHGACEIFVDPDSRGYLVSTVEKDNCGSVTYKGIRYMGGDEGTHEVTVVDHRTRLCEDLLPALFIVEEKRGSFEQTHYSYDR